MDFQREELGVALVGELTPILHDHFKEISANQDIPLDPRWEVYEAAAANGSLRIFTIRDAGRLVGYSVFTVIRNPHYKGSVQATQDILYLVKALRGKRHGETGKSIGFCFIDWCDSQLKADGVQLVYHHVKFSHDWGSMLEKMGYKPVEKIYGRRLDR